MLVLDAIVVTIAFFLSFSLRQHFQQIFGVDSLAGFRRLTVPPSSVGSYLPMVFIVVPLWCAFLYMNGINNNLRAKSVRRVTWVILKTAFLVGVGLGTLIYLFNFIFVSRLFFGIFLIVSFLCVLGEKLTVMLVMKHAGKNDQKYHRLVIVGTGNRALSVIKKINAHPEWGLGMIGAVDVEPRRGIVNVGDLPILGGLDEFEKILKEQAVDEAVFVVPRSRLSIIEDAVRICEIVGVKASIATDLFDMKIAKAKVMDLDGLPFVSFETTVASESQLIIKRTLDVLSSGLGLIVLGPLFILIALSIRLTSPGPVLFKQQRAGRNSRKFTMYKFRTMHDGADKKRFELAGKNEMDGPVFKIKKDPRITRVGKVLRKFSLDELPQLYNVFVGQMSLIGPRALPTYEADDMALWQRRRLSMRPGITCLWQIRGRSNIKFAEWMALDLQYIDQWSLWLDLKILMMTIPYVIFGVGAY